jgi:hypothetical protein
MDLERHAHVTRDFYVGDAVWAFADVLEIRVGNVFPSFFDAVIHDSESSSAGSCRTGPTLKSSSNICFLKK